MDMEEEEDTFYRRDIADGGRERDREGRGSRRDSNSGSFAHTSSSGSHRGGGSDYEAYSRDYARTQGSSDWRRRDDRDLRRTAYHPSRRDSPYEDTESNWRHQGLSGPRGREVGRERKRDRDQDYEMDDDSRERDHGRREREQLRETVSVGRQRGILHFYGNICESWLKLFYSFRNIPIETTEKFVSSRGSDGKSCSRLCYE